MISTVHVYVDLFRTDMMGVGRTLLPLSDDAEISIWGAGRGPADQQSLHQLTTCTWFRHFFLGGGGVDS
jgi:hypothetical protein